MQTKSLTEEDEELVSAAEEVLREHHHPERHRCSAAVRSRSGEIYTSINLISGGQADVHSEPIALGKAVQAGDGDIETSVAVVYEGNDSSNPMQVVSACGVCREMYHTFSPAVDVIVSDGGELVKVPLPDLLPAKAVSDD